MLFHVELITSSFVNLISKQARLVPLQEGSCFYLLERSTKYYEYYFQFQLQNTSKGTTMNALLQNTKQQMLIQAHCTAQAHSVTWTVQKTLTPKKFQFIATFVNWRNMLLEIYKSCIILFRANLDLVPQVLPKTKINFEPCQMTDHTYVVVQIYGWFNFKFSSIIVYFYP